jgi:hypothetical protein
MWDLQTALWGADAVLAVIGVVILLYAYQVVGKRPGVDKEYDAAMTRQPPMYKIMGWCIIAMAVLGLLSFLAKIWWWSMGSQLPSIALMQTPIAVHELWVSTVYARQSRPLSLSIDYVEQRMQLGELQFTDGTTRPVHPSDDGHQFILDDDGEPVYGVRLPVTPAVL